MLREALAKPTDRRAPPTAPHHTEITMYHHSFFLESAATQRRHRFIADGERHRRSTPARIDRAASDRAVTTWRTRLKRGEPCLPTP